MARQRDEPRTKIGAGSFSAWIRTGWREIRAALYPDSNIAQQPDGGIWGNKTPGEVMVEKQGETRDPDEKPSLLKDRLEQIAKGREGCEPDARGLDRD
ncbi:MAG: hypothetical protein HUU22_11050 [Phycisphaerae bacterium]|nr:hypothetical protein [Phycisphaerae bacterium]NUQ46560.1 hypothetical protein [Phycisphaerae bacterium]